MMLITGVWLFLGYVFGLLLLHSGQPASRLRDEDIYLDALLASSHKLPPPPQRKLTNVHDLRLGSCMQQA